VNDRCEQDRQQSIDGPEICQRTRPLDSSERSKGFPKPAPRRFGDALRGQLPCVTTARRPPQLELKISLNQGATAFGRVVRMTDCLRCRSSPDSYNVNSAQRKIKGAVPVSASGCECVTAHLIQMLASRTPFAFERTNRTTPWPQRFHEKPADAECGL
jgi:hypothetical protein